MLHVLNGDSLADIFQKTGLAGDILPWREAIAVGPNPACSAPGERLEIRAQHLTQAYGKDLETVRESLAAQESRLTSLEEDDEIVLWFDHDLFCQANLLFVFNTLDSERPEETKVSLVCPTEISADGKFHGLASKTSEEIRTLFGKREAIADEGFSLVSQAWQMFTDGSPQPLQTLLSDCSYAMPAMNNALQAHLERLPSTKNGLGRIQGLLLDFIAGGVDEFTPLFHLTDEIVPLYGFGDHQIWNELLYLSRLLNPLVTIHNVKIRGAGLPNPDQLEAAYFRLTDQGRAVCVGNSDMLNINRIDYWIGGVHLNDENPLWRWDDEQDNVILDE